MTPLSALRVGIGPHHLLCPNVAARSVLGGNLNPRERTVVRLLGARQLAQALISERAPTVAVLSLGAEVDIAHATSMIALAVYDRRYRRAALVDGFIAAVLAVVGAKDARSVGRKASGLPTASGLSALRDHWADRVARGVVPGHRAIDGPTTSTNQTN